MLMMMMIVLVAPLAQIRSCTRYPFHNSLLMSIHQILGDVDLGLKKFDPIWSTFQKLGLGHQSGPKWHIPAPNK